MITHRHSHVPASGAAPTNVREGNWCTNMVALNCPRNSLLKIKKGLFLMVLKHLFYLLMVKGGECSGESAPIGYL